ncbi:MAG: HupE/UreJ family protein [Burkholderiales bacterium]|nr:HupE/UreJ family protein [Burkholderiales bacterium]
MKPFLKTIRSIGLTIAVLLMTTAAHAHTGDGPHSGWLHGFFHPLSGLDHLLAMIAVGIWSVQMTVHSAVHTNTRAMWLMPAIFVMVMGLGGVLGFIALALPFDFAEHGIALSLLVSGFLIARTVQLPFPVSASLIALFAVCHGYAHGSEMPDGAAVFEYAAGFMLATALLHVTGIGLAQIAYHVQRDRWLRYVGVAVALSGGAMLVGGAG